MTPLLLRNVGAALLGLGLALGVGYPSRAAERLSLSLGPLETSVSRRSLEAFAAGEAPTGDLAIILSQLDDEAQTQVRRLLSDSTEIAPAAILQLANSAMGDDLLQRLGTLIESSSSANGGDIQGGPGDGGAAALRTALTAAAEDPAGLTPLTVLRHFPGEEVRIRTAALPSLLDDVDQLTRKRQQAVESIRQTHQRALDLGPPNDPGETALGPTLSATGGLDLTQLGALGTRHLELSIDIPFASGLLAAPETSGAASKPLLSSLYLPQAGNAPAPLVVLTHPLASTRANFAYLGQHLASHGIAVAIPEHEGSNTARLQAFLRGEHPDLVDAVEYPRRAQEISALLDALDQHPDLGPQLDVERVGVIGASYGATVALALAGGEIDRDRLASDCRPNRPTLNLSILLQCRANDLPPGEYRLRDPRVQAVFALFPLTSVIFGTAGLSQVEGATLFLSASEDLLVPALTEQIQPFETLAASPSDDGRYLMLLDPANHYVLEDAGAENEIPNFLQGDRPDPNVARRYVQAMSVAFFKAHLGHAEADGPLDYSDYLSAEYAQSIRQGDVALYFSSVPRSNSKIASRIVKKSWLYRQVVSRLRHFKIFGRSPC